MNSGGTIFDFSKGLEGVTKILVVFIVPLTLTETFSHLSTSIIMIIRINIELTLNLLCILFSYILISDVFI